MEYDGTSNTVGNITKVTELSGATVQYTYDALYRLTGETRTGSGAYSKTYGYDVAGNISTVNGSTFATYDAANKISTLTGGSVTYDADGNTVIVNATSVGIPYANFSNWTPYGQLGQLRNSGGSTIANLVYDGFGRRVYHSDSVVANKRYIVFDGDRVLGEVTGTGAARVAYTWGPDGLVSERLIQSSQSRYYHFGPQGETRQLTDGLGTECVTSTCVRGPLSTKR
jgi:YD repeat-containing protein